MTHGITSALRTLEIRIGSPLREGNWPDVEDQRLDDIPELADQRTIAAKRRRVDAARRRACWQR